MPATGPWRRRNDSDAWHFCTNCTQYPSGATDKVSYTKPTSGEFCNQCLRKAANNDCR